MSGWQPTSPQDLLSVKYSGGKNWSSTDCTEAGKNLPFGPSPSPFGLSGAILSFLILASASTILEAPHISRKPGSIAMQISAAAGRSGAVWTSGGEGESAARTVVLVLVIRLVLDALAINHIAPNPAAIRAPKPCANRIFA